MKDILIEICPDSINMYIFYSNNRMKIFQSAFHEKSSIVGDTNQDLRALIIY